MGFWGILGPPYCGIGATMRIGQEMLCLPYAGFFCFLSLFPSDGLNFNFTTILHQPLCIFGYL